MVSYGELWLIMVNHGALWWIIVVVMMFAHVTPNPSRVPCLRPLQTSGGWCGNRGPPPLSCSPGGYRPWWSTWHQAIWFWCHQSDVLFNFKLITLMIILFPSRLEERARVKCDQYWPMRGTETYGVMCVTLTDTQVSQMRMRIDLEFVKKLHYRIFVPKILRVGNA